MVKNYNLNKVLIENFLDHMVVGPIRGRLIVDPLACIEENAEIIVNSYSASVRLMTIRLAASELTTGEH